MGPEEGGMNGKELCEAWDERWEEALGLWSRLVMMRSPHWCFFTEEAKAQGLEGSFAMIRLKDHRVVLDASLISYYRLEDFPLEILAHEIGHHVYVPANLQDNGRLLSLVRRALTEKESYAPQFMNLYADHLINYHLQKQKGLAMAEIYQRILAKQKDTSSAVWNLYLAVYERLFSLKPGTLARVPGKKAESQRLEQDSEIGAQIIRSYCEDWLSGAYSYASLYYPYLWEADQKSASITLLLDTLHASDGASGEGGDLQKVSADGVGMLSDHSISGDGRTEIASPQSEGEGPAQRYTSPREYLDYMSQLEPGSFDSHKALARYYTQIASPYVIPFPMEVMPEKEAIIPEGLESWDIGDNPGEIDWLGTLIRSPEVVPGMTTVKKVYGWDDDQNGNERVPDLYIGIDCSGSMRNPALRFSWPVLAGTIIAQSALRAGARVKVVLSGEPGSFMETRDFVKSRQEVMNVLISYLGTGFAFGIPRLADDFSRPRKDRTHILLLTDDDIFAMLNDGPHYDQKHSTWEVADKAIKNGRGGGSLVLYSKPEYHAKEAARLKKEGWDLFYVSNDEELSRFAKAFARKKFGAKR